MRSESEVSEYFKQYLPDHRFSGTLSPVQLCPLTMQQSSCQDISLVFAENEVFDRSFLHQIKGNNCDNKVNRKGSFNSSETHVLWYGHSIE